MIIYIYKGVEIHQEQSTCNCCIYFYANIKKGVLTSNTLAGIKNLITRHNENKNN